MAVPIPLFDPIAKPEKDKKGRTNVNPGYVTDTWVKYFQDQTDIFSTSPTVVGVPVQLTAQNTSLGATSFPISSLASGLYYIDYYAAITTAATTGLATSSLTVTFAWTDLTRAKTLSGAAITGNTTGTVQTGRLMIEIDSATPVTYATTYASDTASQMIYKLSMVLSVVPR